MFQILFFNKLKITSFVLSGVLLGISFTPSVFAMEDENQDEKQVEIRFHNLRSIMVNKHGRPAHISQKTSYQQLFSIHDELYPNAPAKKFSAAYNESSFTKVVPKVRGSDNNHHVPVVYDGIPFTQAVLSTKVAVITEDNWPSIKESYFLIKGDSGITGHP